MNDARLGAPLVGGADQLRRVGRIGSGATGVASRAGRRLVGFGCFVVCRRHPDAARDLRAAGAMVVANCRVISWRIGRDGVAAWRGRSGAQIRFCHRPGRGRPTPMTRGGMIWSLRSGGTGFAMAAAREMSSIRERTRRLASGMGSIRAFGCSLVPGAAACLASGGCATAGDGAI